MSVIRAWNPDYSSCSPEFRHNLCHMVSSPPCRSAKKRNFGIVRRRGVELLKVIVNVVLTCRIPGLSVPFPDSLLYLSRLPNIFIRVDELQ